MTWLDEAVNHRVTIRNFGPIEAIEDFEIKDFNIFLGESGVGKSVVAKVIFLFNDFLFLIPFKLRQKASLEAFVSPFQETIERCFADYKNYYVKYDYGNGYSIEIKDGKIELSNELCNKASDVVKLYELGESGLPTPAELFLLINDLCSLAPVFIPASRSFLLNLSGAIIHSLLGASGSVGVSDFDYLMLKFAQQYYASEHSLKNNKINEIFGEILKGEIISPQGTPIFKPKGKQETYLNLSSLSSGQKEILPVAKVLLDRIQRNIPTLLIFEEPEAHLFPTDQVKILEILTSFVNESKSKLIITTHSPYICYAANNMLFRGKIEGKSNYKIKSENFQAHSLSDGKARSIVQDGEIDTDFIDSVSKATFDEYCELINQLEDEK